MMNLKSHKGTTIQHEPDFGTLKHYWKAIEVYYLDEWLVLSTVHWWPTTSSNTLIVHHNSVIQRRFLYLFGLYKGGLKVIDCNVLRAEH